MFQSWPPARASQMRWLRISRSWPELLGQGERT